MNLLGIVPLVLLEEVAVKATRITKIKEKHPEPELEKKVQPIPIIKQRFAIGLIITGILSVYFRSTWLFTKKEKMKRRQFLLEKLRWKVYPIGFVSILISMIILFFVIFLIPGLIDIIQATDLRGQPLTYSLIYLVPVYYFSIFLFQTFSDKLTS